MVQAALDEAHMTLDEITAIAVTYGPGLVGALLVGVAAAKAIAYAAKKPLVPVHHIEDMYPQTLSSTRIWNRRLSARSCPADIRIL